MVVNEDLRLAFVHIPKCGGTTLRNLLLGHRASKNFSGVRKAHADQSVDFAHLTLGELKKILPEQFDQLKAYWSFAVIRNPRDRFQSSLSQYIRRTRDQGIAAVGSASLKHEVKSVIERLQASDLSESTLDPDFIHFERQHKYIYLDNEKIVTTIFSIEDLTPAFDALKCRGVSIDNQVTNSDSKANRSTYFRNNTVGELINRLRPAAKPLISRMPAAVKNRLRSAVYSPDTGANAQILEDTVVRDFVDQFYQRDIEMWNAFNDGAEP